MDDSVGAWLSRSLRVNASRIAIESDQGALTYGQLDAWSRVLQDQLEASGVRAGDTVALYTGNREEFLVGDVAIARMGAVRTPINELLPPATVAHIVKHSDTRALLVGPQLAERAATALAEIGEDIPVWQADDGVTPLLAGATPLVRPAAGAPATRHRAQQVGPDELAALLYTGGTTGQPKGAAHSQRGWAAFHTAQLIEAEIRQQDRLLLMTPLAHAAGVFAQSAMLRGATVMLRSGFDVEATLRAFRDEAVSWTFLVPTMIYRLLEAAGPNAAFPSVETIVYGAAPITPARLSQALRVFGPVFIQLYGQTECPNWGTRLVKTDHDDQRPELLTSCGQASTMAEVTVIDDEGDDVPVGEPGEVCLRAPYTLLRYHRDEQASAAKFVGDRIRTGDIGVLDDAGYLYLKDRRADMVITGGMNVYCKEVEDVLATHPSVSSVAVIGIPHEDWGEAVHAVVVAGGPVQEDELLGWVRDRLAAYARPKSVEFTDQLPETPLGKIDKRALRAHRWGANARAIN